MIDDPDALSAAFAGDPIAARQAEVWIRAAPPRDVAPVLPGERYELAQQLGAGATATVWQAYDRRLARHVAIKCLHATDGDGVELGLEEARASSEVISEHVVRVYDVQHDADPPFIVLELVAEHGKSSGRLEIGASAASCRPDTTAEAIAWVRDVARGVHDAHLRDVFHRDLKPHNVLVTPSSRRAKVADFGLAVTPQRGGARGRIVGTPRFMAPELARGLGSLDACIPAQRAALIAIDVWGLGALAYELITGRAPWQAATDLAAWEWAASGRPPPPIEVPARLRRVIARAMAIRPDDRYSSAAALADELDALLARRPTSFDRGPVARFGLWIRRNPHLTVSTIAACTLAVAAVGAFATTRDLRTRSRALASEIDEVEHRRAASAARAAAARHEVDEVERDLAAHTATLETLRRQLDTTRADYETLRASKERALSSATAAERALATAASEARADRDIAESGRALYESFWNRAREDARLAATDREVARRELDAARMREAALQHQIDALAAEPVILSRPREAASSTK